MHKPTTSIIHILEGFALQRVHTSLFQHYKQSDNILSLKVVQLAIQSW